MTTSIYSNILSVINTLALGILVYMMCAIHLIYHVAETFVRHIYVLYMLFTVKGRSQLIISNEHPRLTLLYLGVKYKTPL